jgi:hypothetical protein
MEHPPPEEDELPEDDDADPPVDVSSEVDVLLPRLELAVVASSTMATVPASIAPSLDDAPESAGVDASEMSAQ